MTKALRLLAVVMGVVCMAIGIFHFTLGIDSVPGEGSAGATVDSRERFYGAIFFAYGCAWYWSARRFPVQWMVIRLLALAFFIGGLGRLLSMVIHGQPQWFQVVLTVIEVALPLVFLWPLSAVKHAVRQAVASGDNS